MNFDDRDGFDGILEHEVGLVGLLDTKLLAVGLGDRMVVLDRLCEREIHGAGVDVECVQLRDGDCEARTGYFDSQESSSRYGCM